MIKKPIFAWDDEEEESSIPDSEIVDLQQALSAEDEKAKELEEYEITTIPNTVSAFSLNVSEIKKLQTYSEDEPRVERNHIVLTTNYFYKEVSEDLNCKISDVDAVYSWYIERLRKEMVQNKDCLKVNLEGLGTFQVSLKCILGTVYKRIMYAEKLLEFISKRNYRDPDFKRKAKERVISPGVNAFHEARHKYSLLQSYPEFKNSVVEKTIQLFEKIGTKIPKLYERI